VKHRLAFHGLLLLAVFLPLAPTSSASTKWYVDGVKGNDNHNCKSHKTACKTISHAITLASFGDSIMVAAATYQENLNFSGLTIIGSSVKTTIIDGGVVNTVVTIYNSSASVTLSKLTIRNGLAQYGGGVSNSGTLTISDSVVSSNNARFPCRYPGCMAVGGGIYNHGGTLTISNSTISGNTASAGRSCIKFCRGIGGGIYNNGMLTINNSTISGNTASSSCNQGCAPGGGGISNDGAVTINNSTVSANSAFIGGGVENHSAATLQNSIVANSPSGGNCNGTMTSNGYNLSSDGTCNFNGTGDLNNTDPKLGQLGNYGGPTQTIPLRAGSPAIDAGNPSGCTDGNGHLLKTDQRGKPRPDKEDTGGCDMGAYERQKG
jgi:hypothetical protein